MTGSDSGNRNDQSASPTAPDMASAAGPLHRAVELTAGGSQAQILHRGQVYFLRITRAGKLILTK